MSPTPKKLAVFVSGTGTLLESFLNNGFHVDLVLADRPCRGIDIIAKEKNVPTELVLRTDFSKNFDREAYTEQVLAVLQKHEIDVVAMAGFNTVLAPSIFEVYGGRILNTHPALLPSFKGHYAVRDALAYGVKVTGCTVHIATPEIDVGKILAQKAVPVLSDDTEESLHERIKEVERTLYLEAIRAFITTL
ncbi:phosphoribosylglycinamide formyltransferase [Candidatus Kaiserbacteria bacterium RIFOXYD1_FULL_47_14]|uniref:Phosphoribosylglycinamide formyltransferase n=1 Tax=Candidatus Kaiserbacteria bacterium RIFOXYD1_FULL_47_14 TaxID=1798533 RepID=A0A1F6G5M2_9BACT|nr:MAG: phosphoribosylglycinamide formyltransferase [Candidatus Kaiserbacteria bacterium RIFOXYD1_FULL_47_14]